MDPTETLRILIESLHSEDYDAAAEAIQDLREWMSRGGCLPAPNAADWNKLLDLLDVARVTPCGLTMEQRSDYEQHVAECRSCKVHIGLRGMNFILDLAGEGQQDTEEDS